MKITHTILALLAAGFLGHSAFGADTSNTYGPLGLAIMQDGHGGTHIVYYQTFGQQGTTSVALSTSSGGVMDPSLIQGPPQADNGQTRFVSGTNQHGQPTSAYIPLTSHFAQASQ